MKRTMLTVSILAGFAMLVSLAFAGGGESGNHSKGYTEPILVEKDSDAVATGFYIQPGTDGKFSQDYDVGVRDIYATPGAKISDYNEDMLFKFNPRGTLDPLHGVGPEDMFIDETSDGVQLKGILEYELVGNKSGRRITIGTIRKEKNSGEFEQLFGSDPLEDGLIGDVSAGAPYDGGLYPAAIMDPNKSFQYCVPSGGIPFYHDCVENLKSVGQPYSDIHIYDLEKYGDDLLVGASYDPFVLNVNSEVGIAKDEAAPSMQTNPKEFPATYISPLVLFKRDGDRVRFLGYTSFETPEISKLNFHSSFFTSYKTMADWILTYSALAPFYNNTLITENQNSYMQYALTNPYIPVLANPVDVESGGDWLSALYLNTFIDLDGHVLNPYGRPYVFPDNKHHTYLELLGVKVGGEYKPLSETIYKNYFPDGLTTPIAIWSEDSGRAGEEAPDPKDYGDSSPSNRFSPTMLALVSPGSKPNVYDHAIMVDFAKTTNPQKKIVVASYIQGATGNKGVLYLIDFEDASTYLWMKSWEIDAAGYPKYKTGTMEAIATYTMLPVVIPKSSIVLDLPGNNYVPYKVITADLAAGDACHDIIVTWRGANTIFNDNVDGKPVSDKGSVRFDNGSGAMFASKFTIVHRVKQSSGNCLISKKATIELPAGEKPAQAAAVAVGDVDGNGRPDIVATNLTLEPTYESTTENPQYSSFAYVFLSKLDENAPDGSKIPAFNTVDSLKLRAGFRNFTSIDAGVGSGNVSMDMKAMLFTNGLPLMLPPVSCPSTDENIPAVGSMYGTMTSALFSLSSSYYIGLSSPFAETIDDKNYVPIPPYCEQKTACAVAGDKFETNVPLWNDDCMTENCPWADTKPEYCADKCIAYYSLCSTDKDGNPVPKPHVGFVNCYTLKALCYGTASCDNYLKTDMFDKVQQSCCDYFELHSDEYADKTLPPLCSLNLESCKSQYFEKDLVTVPEKCCEYFPQYDVAGKDYTAFNCCNIYANNPDKYPTMPGSCCDYYAGDVFQKNGGKIPDSCCDYYTSNAYQGFGGAWKDIPSACCAKGYKYSNHKGCCHYFQEIDDPNKDPYGICYGGETSMLLDQENFEKEGADKVDSSGDTEFASWRPDVVYSSNGHAIAMASDTVPAGDEGEPDASESSKPMATPTTLADYLFTESLFMLLFRDAQQPADDPDQTPPSCSFTDPAPGGATPDGLDSLGTAGSLGGLDMLDQGTKPFTDTYFGAGVGAIPFDSPVPATPNFDKMKIPHGTVMPGLREITAIIPYVQPPKESTCPNNKLDAPPEDCDIVNGSLVHQSDLEGCTECTAQCICLYGTTPTTVDPIPCGNNLLNAAEECDVVNGKVEGPVNCICSGDCTCTYPPPALIEEIKPEEPLPAEPIEAEMPAAAPTPIMSDCFVQCPNHMTNENDELFNKMNEDNYRSVTGRRDDFFCEMWQKVKVVCYVRNAFKAVTVGGETIWKANPYMMTQDGGFRFDPPETESKVQDFNLINYVILFPHEPVAGEGKAMATFTLPDLSMAQDAQIIYGGVTPNAMPAESVIHGADGSTTIINNMIKHTMDRILPENFQAMFKGQEVAAGDSGLSDAIHTTEFIIPYFAIFSTVIESGRQTIKNLEEQGVPYEDLLIENQPTPEYVREDLKTKIDGATTTSDITYDTPWAKQSHYKFSLITEQGGASSGEVGAKATTIAPSSLAISQFSVAATDPTVARGGAYASALGSCVKCTMYDDDIDLKAILALMAFVLISSGGVAAVRVVVHIRRRKR